MMHRDQWRRGSRRTGYLMKVCIVRYRLVIEIGLRSLDGWNGRLTFEELRTANTVGTI